MVADAKRDVRAWNALYQQRPASEEGDFFKLEWFSPFARFSNPDIVYYGASDYAVTEGSGDYTEHGIFAVDPMGMIYIVDWWRGHTAPDVWIERQCDLIMRYRPMAWFGESGPIRRAVAPYLARRMNERQAYCRIEWLPSVAQVPGFEPSIPRSTERTSAAASDLQEETRRHRINQDEYGCRSLGEARDGPTISAPSSCDISVWRSAAVGRVARC
jgi:hypothetical protein